MDTAHSTVRAHPNTAGIICFHAAASFLLAILLAFILVPIYLIVECLMLTRQWYLAYP
jgi:hypothetical protein